MLQVARKFVAFHERGDLRAKLFLRETDRGSRTPVGRVCVCVNERTGEMHVVARRFSSGVFVLREHRVRVLHAPAVVGEVFKPPVDTGLITRRVHRSPRRIPVKGVIGVARHHRTTVVFEELADVGLGVPPSAGLWCSHTRRWQVTDGRARQMQDHRPRAGRPCCPGDCADTDRGGHDPPCKTQRVRAGAALARFLPSPPSPHGALPTFPSRDSGRILGDWSARGAHAVDDREIVLAGAHESG